MRSWLSRSGRLRSWLQFYETNYGPTIRAKSILERADRWGDCRAELADLFLSQNRSTDGTDVRIEAEYMLIVARPQARRADRQDAPDRGPHLVAAARPTIQQRLRHALELEIPAARPTPRRTPNPSSASSRASSVR